MLGKIFDYFTQKDQELRAAEFGDPHNRPPTLDQMLDMDGMDLSFLEPTQLLDKVQALGAAEPVRSQPTLPARPPANRSRSA